jgi:class 3 adenylate cyclase
MHLHTTYLIINLVRVVILAIASAMSFSLHNLVLAYISIACVSIAAVYLVMETLSGVSERKPWFCFLPTSLDIAITDIFLYFTGISSFMVGAYAYITAICALNTKVPQASFSFAAALASQTALIALVTAGALPYENVFDDQPKVNLLSLIICLAIVQIVNFAVWRIIHGLVRSNQQLIGEVSLQKEKADALLHNTLPSSVVTELKKNDGYVPKLLPRSAVVFTDFVNFTSTVNGHHPQDILSQLDSYFSAFDLILEKYGLERLKTIGDGYMFFSGFDPGTARLLDTCRAAIEINEYVTSRLDSPENLFSFNLRVGIACGDVIGGIVGRKRFAFDIWGSTVNLAARLESATPPGTILICEDLAAIVAPHFHLRACRPIRLKGFAARRVYLLGRPKDQALSPPPAPPLPSLQAVPAG